MKTRLSSMPIILWIICGMAILLLLVTFILSFRSYYIYGKWIESPLSSLVSLLLVSALFAWSFKLNKVEFDDTHLYVRRSGSEAKTIPFEKLMRVNSFPPISMDLYPFFVLTIHYENETGELRKVKCGHQRLVSFSFKKNKMLERFVSMVRAKNSSFYLNV